MGYPALSSKNDWTAQGCGSGEVPMKSFSHTLYFFKNLLQPPTHSNLFSSNLRKCQGPSWQKVGGIWFPIPQWPCHWGSIHARVSSNTGCMCTGGFQSQVGCQLFVQKIKEIWRAVRKILIFSSRKGAQNEMDFCLVEEGYSPSAIPFPPFQQL